MISRTTPPIEKPSKSAHDRETNCPNGLRKRNVDWNHVFSPYWMNGVKNRPESLEEQGNCDETIIASERSNTDHGFESFNGNCSSSEELATPSTVSEILS